MKRIFMLMVCSVMSMHPAWSLNLEEQSLLQRLTKSMSVQEVSSLESLVQRLEREKLKYQELIAFNHWIDENLYDVVAVDDQVLEPLLDDASIPYVSAAFLKLLHHELSQSPDESLIEFLTRKYVSYSGPKSSEMLYNHIGIIVPHIREFEQIVASYVASHSFTGKDLGMLIVFGEYILDIQSHIVSDLRSQINSLSQVDEKPSDFYLKMNEIFKVAHMLGEQLADIRPALTAVQSLVHDVAHESSFAPSLDPEVQKDVKAAQSLLAKLKSIQIDFDAISASLIPLRLKIVEEKDSGWQEVYV